MAQRLSLSSRQDPSIQRHVVVLITDMIRYSQRTAGMSPEEIRDFIIRYYRKLRALTGKESAGYREFESFAGDASVSIYDGGVSEGRNCIRALAAAVRIARSVESGEIPATRVGVYSGPIIQAAFGNQTLKFGNTFSAANRLEELCEFFGTRLLFGRKIAAAQETERNFIVNIGKITPKNFLHPVHVFSIYKPGFHNCPSDIDKTGLIEFIRLKNRAMQWFTGDQRAGIEIDFARCRRLLEAAEKYFKNLTGCDDTASIRILEYIRQNPYPTEDFAYNGMKIEERLVDSIGFRLLRLSRDLFKSMDREFYNTLVVNTNWEHYFQLQWYKRDAVVFKKGDPPDGIYYIDKGEVEIKVDGSRVIAVLAEGDIFGEMAYFSESGIRNATVVAKSDLVVHRIATEDFRALPVIQKIFRTIAEKRFGKSG